MIVCVLCLLLMSVLILHIREKANNEKAFDQIFPIAKIEHDCIISKQGDITYAFELQLPEIFTLSSDDYENLHHTWIRAIRILPCNTIVHKQDWYTEEKYSPIRNDDSASFLQKSSDAYFKGRPYLKHHCILMITQSGRKNKLSSSAISNLIRPTIIPRETISEQNIHDFQDKIGQFKKLLQEGGFINIRQLTTDELTGSEEKTGILERYCFLLKSEDKPILKDISFKPEMKIGENYCQLFSLSDVEDLPSLCGPRITYDKFSTDQSKFSIGFATPIGSLLECNHIYNQVIITGDTPLVLKKFEAKRKRLQSLSAYSRENAIGREATNQFLNEAISQQRLPVKAHFSVMIWSDDREILKTIRNKTSASIAQLDAIPRQETRGAAQIFWACLPGNAADFPANDMFDTFTNQAVCFLNLETSYRSDDQKSGIRFCDRAGTPVYVDLFDKPRKQGITSNMGFLCCGTSGGGKSMVVNHILQTLHSQGAHCVVVDIGGSYRGLCALTKGYYFTYEEANPIRFNPFYLPEGQFLDTEKKESLKSLLVALWKQENESFNRSEYVALSNALQGYYQHLNQSPSVFPCFNSFYEYLQDEYVEILKHHNVKERDFDVNNFLYVLRPFYKDGEFDYLLNATEELDLLSQSFVVIELDNIKDHPILFSVVTLIIMEMFISKMRKLQSVRKVLVVDEAWKAIAKNGMAEFLKYAYKTIRKFNGVPGVVTQELDDVISSPIIKEAIIANADIRIMMDMRKFMNKFDKLQDAMGMSDKGKSTLLSVNKDDREFYLEMGGKIMKVFRNELCPEEYFTYSTDGKERVIVQQYAEKYGSFEEGIKALLNDKAISNS